MGFEYASPSRILFGDGMLARVSTIASEFGCRALIVAGGGSVSLDSLLDTLQPVGINASIYQVTKEPDVDTVQSGLDLAKTNNCEFVIGFGGGSVLDAGKAISAMLTNTGEIHDYLEVIGAGKEIPFSPAPMIAVPTTAGPGTEVTRNAVIRSAEHQVKVSMRSLKMIPDVAIIDPTLTYSMPPHVTASTGMDALTQVIEGYVSLLANPMTDPVCREGIIRGAKSLLQAYTHGDDSTARQDMCLTSLFGGLAVANGGLGAVHGFAGPLGGMYEVPHGVVCARLLPYVMKYNIAMIKQIHADHPILLRYQDIAKWLTGDDQAALEDGLDWINDLGCQLAIPGLNQLGIHENEFGEIVEKSMMASSMKKNPVSLSESILRMILEEAY